MLKTESIASIIDHTLLKPDATQMQIVRLCEEALDFGFASVCINPVWVALAAEKLNGSPVKVCTVIGFPLGASTIAAKRFEALDAIMNGAQEIDMVMNIGALKSGYSELVKEEIQAIVENVAGCPVKVILEVGLLTAEEMTRACLLAQEAGAAFVKTSTGFGPGNATIEAVQLMAQTVGASLGVKAAGGIRDFETAKKMIDAGATRLGTSASLSIVLKEGIKKSEVLSY
jgi:deoxyribose-phosphate aldolase